MLVMNVWRVAISGAIIAVHGSTIRGCPGVVSVIVRALVSVTVSRSFVGSFFLHGFVRNGFEDFSVVLETIGVRISRHGGTERLMDTNDWGHSLILAEMHWRMLNLLVHHWMV